MLPRKCPTQQNKTGQFICSKTGHLYLLLTAAYDRLHERQWEDSKGRTCRCQWMNQVPLNGREDSILVNYFCYEMRSKDKEGREKVVYRNSWVTDFEVSFQNVEELIRVARCRWKNENECFNVMKNHGYFMEHNYGHGKEHLCYNFYLLTLLAFSFHQIFELTDALYQSCRKKCGSKQRLWERVRTLI